MKKILPDYLDNHGKVSIIAEIGVNHNGSVELAKKLILGAVDAGADFVKFQTWVTEELVSADAPLADYQKNRGDYSSQFQMLKQLELPFAAFRELRDFAFSHNIGFLSTPFDFKSLDFLVDELGLELIKIGSGDISNIPFLRRVGRKKVDVILSTGMAYEDEIHLAYNSLVQAGAKSVALLHCTSAYPAPFDSINLKAMLSLKSLFPTCAIGYSDHSIGNDVSIAAVAMGAKIIEKHFTLDKNLPGPDHRASIDTEELNTLVRSIRNIELALTGSGEKGPSKCEVETRAIVSRGLYLNRDLKKGELLTEDCISIRRPANGCSPIDLDRMTNQKALLDLSKNSSLKLEYFTTSGL